MSERTLVKEEVLENGKFVVRDYSDGTQTLDIDRAKCNPLELALMERIDQLLMYTGYMTDVFNAAVRAMDANNPQIPPLPIFLKFVLPKLQQQAKSGLVIV